MASKVRYTSEVAAAHGVVHMLLMQNFCLRLNAVVMFRKVRCKSNFAQVRAEYTFGELYTNYICIYKEAQSKSELHQTITSSPVARPPSRLCCRPAVFSCHLRLIALSFVQGYIRHTFQECYIFYVSLTVHPCIILYIKPTWCTIYS